MIYAAAAINFFIFLLHVFGGGPPTVGPLLASNDIGRVSKNDQLLLLASGYHYFDCHVCMLDLVSD